MVFTEISRSLLQEFGASRSIPCHVASQLYQPQPGQQQGMRAGARRSTGSPSSTAKHKPKPKQGMRARADPLVLHHQQLNLNLNLNRACGRAQIHWFSIINSCVTVLLLTGFLATILMRVLKNDFVRFGNDEETGAPPAPPAALALPHVAAA